MSRILKAYKTQFRALLRHAGARRLEQGVRWLLARAEQRSAATGISLAGALAQVHRELAARPRFQTRQSSATPTRFFCDAGLGGLARWLRAAGYEAFWEQGIDDDVLLREAKRTATTILTTDSMVMERSVLRDGIIPAFWLPPILRIQEQLALVFREFGLVVLAPRCMSCGGELRRADKESLREQIPPRTYRWLDEYFVCTRCGKLFWHGTHWARIQDQLRSIGRAADHACRAQR